MPGIQRADPGARRRALLLAVAIGAAGWAAFFVLQEWLADLQTKDPAIAREALEDAMIWGTWAATLPVLVFATWLWLLGARVRRAERYPPPGAKVIRDTPVLTGREARSRGALLQVFALILGVCGAGTLIAVHRLVVRLDHVRPEVSTAWAQHTRLRCPPARNDSTLSASSSTQRWRASLAAQAMCGVTIRFGIEGSSSG
jgi:hypothetical protein